MANFPTNGDDAIFGNDSDNNIDALNGNDIIFGGKGDDTLTGGGGDDLLTPGTGRDELNGGNGIDTVFYSFDAVRVIASLETGSGWHVSRFGALTDRDDYSGIENLTGTTQNDELEGNRGANLLRGLGGEDTLEGGSGADTLEGGSGHDKLEGESGADRLLGMAGADNIYAGPGADTIDGGADFDHLHYDDSTSGVTVKLKTGEGDGGYAQGDSLTNVEGVVGSNFADILWGTDSANTLTSLNGNDEVRGADGNDFIDTGQGADTVFGGSGDDRVFAGDGGDSIEGGLGLDTSHYHGSDEAVVVDLQTGAATGGFAQGDSLAGIEHLHGSAHNDILRGDSGFNTLTGALGNDILRGRGGVDVLIGGLGKDTLDGGLHSDVYQYDDYNDSRATTGLRDIIETFQQGFDTIELSAIDADIGQAGNQAFDFIATDEFNGEFGELRYRHANGNTFIDANLFGDTAAEFSIRVNGTIDVTEADFFL